MRCYLINLHNFFVMQENPLYLFIFQMRKLLQGGSQRVWKSYWGVWWFGVSRVQAGGGRSGGGELQCMALSLSDTETCLHIGWYTAPASKCCCLLGLLTFLVCVSFKSNKPSTGKFWEHGYSLSKAVFTEVGTACIEFSSNQWNKKLRPLHLHQNSFWLISASPLCMDNMF